ncbi:MAG: pyruvate, water dikinase [Deltaproteobacteria bacterium]|nr:pyruvate, water dikinase [Deltaproteobacteria bacterium]
MDLLQKFKNFFQASPRAQAATDHDEQNEIFKARYQAFRRLLAANNACLDTMTELEEAARGRRHFGMHFLRSRVTTITAKVMVIVDSLLFLAPDKYAALRDVLQKIQEALLKELGQRPATRCTEFILDLSEITAEDMDIVGGKTANLGELRNRLNMLVPDGFAITAHAYATFMQKSGLWDQINCLVLGHPMASYFAASRPSSEIPDPEDDASEHSITLLELCAKIRGMVLEAEVPSELKQAILQAHDRLRAREGREINVALRSSALGEDSARTSFAGQYKSLLNLNRDSLMEGYKEVVASKYSPHAMTYRYMRGIRDDDVMMCVGCLSMVTSRAGGVAYTVNPLDVLDTNIHITSAWGMAKGVVDGTAATDHFTVVKADPPRIATQDISRKASCLACSEVEGVCRVSVDPKLCEAWTIEPAQVLELACTAMRIENHYGCPQDIEWAFTPNLRLFLLQTRPLEVSQTSVTTTAPPTECQPIIRGGVAASPGVAHGVAHIVKKDVDLLLVPPKAILVSVEASPKWAAVLPRCQGIVSEQGSAAGHLANVAREFGIPALFGVKDATKKLAPGAEITMDSNNCAVYAGRQDILPDCLEEAPSPMKDSPVFQTLERLNEHIVPLNLIDPDAVNFTASNCRTLHDITRFCHEKAVQEMFIFGRDHDFSPRSSKQLKTIVPMQWWIINLEDGFYQEIQGPMVPLDNIASIPMLALWRGIIAFPWDGPPSLDGRGFLSVLFQATANRNLEPGMASDFANKNYFMISKHFCNLQSRFGFHFTSVEALAGPRPRENYIRFQFKGGAADLQRRVRRAHFVGEILDEFDFQTQIREDALFARLDDCDQEFIEKHLEILGHILMHTRQLDMIMSRDDVVQFYKNRILNQLHQLMKDQTPSV